MGQARSALCSSASQHFASVFGCHSLAETVLFFSLQFFRLIRSNHSKTLLSRRNLAIIKYIVFGQAMSISNWTKPSEFKIFLAVSGKSAQQIFQRRTEAGQTGLCRCRVKCTWNAQRSVRYAEKRNRCKRYLYRRKVCNCP